MDVYFPDRSVNLLDLEGYEAHIHSRVLMDTKLLENQDVVSVLLISFDPRS